MADVGLHRSHQQRSVGVARAAVGGRGGLHLDRIAERRAGAVRLEVVDVAAAEAGAGEHRADEALLRTAIGHREAAGGAVLVHRAARDDGADPVAVALGVAQPLEHQDAAALAAHVAVGGGVEGLAASDGRQHPRAGGRDHGDRAQQDVHPTGQRHVAIAEAQGLSGLMDRDQRRAARGVDGHCRALEAQREGDPTGDGVERVAGDEVRFDLVDRPGRQQMRVLVGGHAHEDSGAAAAQRGGRVPGPFQPLPDGFERQPLLRLDPDGLAR